MNKKASAFIGGWGYHSLVDGEWFKLYDEFKSKLKEKYNSSEEFVIYFDQSLYSLEFVRKFSKQIYKDFPFVSLNLVKIEDDSYLYPFVPYSSFDVFSSIDKEGQCKDGFTALSMFEGLEFIKPLQIMHDLFNNVIYVPRGDWYTNVYKAQLSNPCLNFINDETVDGVSYIVLSHTTTGEPEWNADMYTNKGIQELAMDWSDRSYVIKNTMDARMTFMLGSFKQ